MSITKKTVKNPQKTTSSLYEKLETPKINFTTQKKTGIVNNVTGNNFSVCSNNLNSNTIDIPLKRNNFIVRLKVNKTLYQQIFQSQNGDIKKSIVEPDGFDTISNISEISFEISKEKNIEIPEIYP